MGTTVPASAPEALDAFVRSLNEADLDTTTNLLAREACLVTPDATVIKGRSDVTLAFKQFVTIGFQARLDLRSVLEIADVALVVGRWTTQVGAGGSASSTSTRGTVILRVLEGRWKILLAAPWGWADRPLGIDRHVVERIPAAT